MKSIILLICLSAIVPVALAQNAGWSQNVSPLAKPTGHVNDDAGVIDEGTKQTIESKLRAFKEKSGVEIAVAVIRTTGERDIFDYSLAVARGWGIGLKTDDNPGLLMLVAIDDRKYFTQLSKDLEDELPDGVAGSLQRQNLVPEFRKGNYGKGISDTLDAYVTTIEQKTSGLAPAPQAGTENSESDPPVSLFTIFCCLAVILFIVLLIWANLTTKRKSKDDNDRWGGGGSGVSDALPWIIIGSGSSSSSGSSWGGSSSGGSDWGGFGGGGDFGGGGAGGDW